MTARTNTCLWCGRTFPTPTEHMIHLHDEHPDTIGRGRTMSREWTCERCGAGNRPTTHLCHGCDHASGAVLASNATRTFTVNVRQNRFDPLLATEAMSWIRARAKVEAVASHLDIRFDSRRVEAWDGDRRICWIEVAVVTAGTRYIKPK